MVSLDSGGVAVDNDTIIENSSGQIEVKSLFKALSIYADNTEKEVFSSTSETDLCSITISQDDLGADFSILVNAGIMCKIYAGSSGSTDFKLYVGGVLKRTITLTDGTDGAGSGTNLTYYQSGLDSTAGDIIVKISATNSVSASQHRGINHGLSVLAIQ